MKFDASDYLIKDRTQPKQSRLWPFLTICAIAAIVTSLLSPLTWHDYLRYIKALLGWELAAALLTAAAVVITSLFIARMHRTSGIVAVSLFMSVVLHMVLVSFFGYVTLKKIPASPSPTGMESVSAISFGPPSLSESIAGQELRAIFHESARTEAQRLSDARKNTGALREAKSIQQQARLQNKDLSDRSPVQMKIEDVFASKSRPDILEVLAQAPVKTPDVSKPDITPPRPVKSAVEKELLPAPDTKKMNVNPLKADRAGLQTETKTVSRDVKVTDVDRQFSRQNVEVAVKQKPLEQKVEDAMRNTSIADTSADLRLTAATVNSKESPQPKDAKLQPQDAFEVARRPVVSPDIAAPTKVSREVVAAPSRTKSTSFVDPVRPPIEKQPTVKDMPISAAGGRESTLAQTFQIQDTLAGMTDNDSGNSAPTPTPAGDRKNLRAERTGRSLSSTETMSDKPKAQINLEARSDASDTTFVSSGTGKEGPTRTQKLAVREGLSSPEGRPVEDQTVVDMGGAITAIETENRSQEVGGTGLARNRQTDIEISRASAGEDNSSVAYSSQRPRSAVVLSGSPSAPEGRAMRLSSDLPVGQSQASPTTHRKPQFDSLKEVSGLPATTLPFVDVGGEAPRAVAGTDRRVETGDTTGIPREGKQVFPGSRNRTTSGDIGLDKPLSQRPRREGIVSGVESFHGSLADKSVLSAAETRSRVEPVSGEISEPGESTGAARAAAMGSVIVPGEVQSAPNAVALASGEQSTRQATRAEIHVDKATGGSSSTLGENVRLTRTSAKPGDYSLQRAGSLVSSSEIASGTSSATPENRGMDRHYALASTRSSAPEAGPFSFQMSAKEAVEQGRGAGRSLDQGRGVPSSRAEVSVTKAGGQTLSEVVYNDSGPIEFDSSSLSSPANRAPVRLDMNIGGGVVGEKSLAATDISAGEVGNQTGRTLISAELSSVPSSVPEKAIYRLRSPERRREFIKELGGSEKTEDAVESALTWLAKAQSDDGHWDVARFKTISQCGGPGDQIDENVALTGLCLLSYLGAGYTHVKGDYKETVRKALNWLLVGQEENGNLERNGQLYGQAMATAALCECYSMTGDKRLKEPVERAVSFILKAQNPEAGWRYKPRTDNDTSVTGWQVLALKSASIAGISFPALHFQWVEMWLDKVRRGKEGGLYTYMQGHGATPTMTAEGWFCQLMMREQTRTRGQAETIPYLIRHLPSWSANQKGSISLYYWYYATLALHMSGAPEFASWNKALIEALLKGQEKRGAKAGSWNPDICILGERGGRVYSTAISTLCLEVYYRYLPFYKQK